MQYLDEIKERVDIVAAARLYGMQVNNHGQALCCFHPDKHPSLSFKYNRYKCFACGASGSALDLVMALCGLDLMGAANRLNEDFNLDLEQDKPRGRTKLQKSQALLLSGFNRWIDGAIKELQDIKDYYKSNKSNYFEPLNSKYDTYIEELFHIECILNVLQNGDSTEQVEVYRRSEIEQIKRRSFECFNRTA
jgi:hypothetical protein